MTNKYELSEKWILWYHHINDNDWSEESYKKVMEINSLQDFWILNKSIKTVNAGMFFLMREHIFPRWEDINNIDGGHWTFRITKKDTDLLWNKLQCYLIGNTLVKDVEMMKEINGISISPKISNCIFKIWIRDSNLSNNNIFSDDMNEFGTAFYVKHDNEKK
jgi:translation initiation factor 4E